MNKEILVVDDNPDIRFLICNILKEQNFNVRSAANYDQAVIEINKKDGKIVYKNGNEKIETVRMLFIKNRRIGQL